VKPKKKASPDPLLAALDWERGIYWQATGPGDSLVGTFERLDHRAKSNGELFPVVEIRTDEGVLYAVWLFHTVLRQQFRAARPQPGERVAVRYDGQRQSGGGRPYHAYRVRAEHQLSESVGWDSLDAGGAEDWSGV